MKKRIWSVLLVICLVLMLAPASLAYSDGGWNDAYRQYVLESGWKKDFNDANGSITCALFDMDRDGTPELVLHYKDSIESAISMQCVFYSYRQNQMVMIGEGDGHYPVSEFQYAPASAYSGLFFFRQDRGFDTINYYSVKNGSAERELVQAISSMPGQQSQKTGDSALLKLGQRTRNAASDHEIGTLRLYSPKQISAIGWDAFVSGSATQQFTDVPVMEYYAPAVYWALSEGITSGTGATTFSPNAACTRGQMVTFLWRAAGEPTPKTSKNPFTDVKKSDYFYAPVLWAAENGITSGTSSTTFSPNATVNRAQVVTFLWRTAGKPVVNAKNPFSDVKSGDYFADAVLWAAGNGITAGKTNTTFAPNDPCVRGQIVTFLYRNMQAAQNVPEYYQLYADIVREHEARYGVGKAVNTPPDEPIALAFYQGVYVIRLLDMNQDGVDEMILCCRPRNGASITEIWTYNGKQAVQLKMQLPTDDYRISGGAVAGYDEDTESSMHTQDGANGLLLCKINGEWLFASGFDFDYSPEKGVNTSGTHKQSYYHFYGVRGETLTPVHSGYSGYQFAGGGKSGQTRIDGKAVSSSTYASTINSWTAQSQTILLNYLSWGGQEQQIQLALTNAARARLGL